MAADAFSRELYQRIHGYFSENNLSRYANRDMKIKVIGAFTWWLVSAILLFAIEAGMWGFFGLYLFHAFAQNFIHLNIGHDANHNAIFRNKRLSRLLHYSYDLCGVSSYMWREMHDNQHHNVMNIQGLDENLEAKQVLRYNHHRKWKPLFRNQHIYIWLLYCVYAADWTVFKDFTAMLFPYTDRLRSLKGKHPAQEVIIMVMFKLFYVGYMIVLPVVWLGFPLWYVLTVFMVATAIIGMVTALIIQTSHLVASAEWPKSRKEYSHHVYHIFATTADYAMNSKLAYWYTGGLHLHVAHHLSPNICHTHYPAITKIVAELTGKYGVPYRTNPTMRGAIKEHMQHIKNMAQKPAEESVTLGVA